MNFPIKSNSICHVHNTIRKSVCDAWAYATGICALQFSQLMLNCAVCLRLHLSIACTHSSAESKITANCICRTGIVDFLKLCAKAQWTRKYNRQIIIIDVTSNIRIITVIMNDGFVLAKLYSDGCELGKCIASLQFSYICSDGIPYVLISITVNGPPCALFPSPSLPHHVHAHVQSTHYCDMYEEATNRTETST